MKERCIHRHDKKSHPACHKDGNVQSGIIIPDIHFPKHDKRAYPLVMQFAEGFKPDIFVNLGDIGHFDGISHWNKKRYALRKKYPIHRDFEMCREHHRVLRGINPTGEIYSLGGNHDQEWPERWLEDNPEFEGYFDYEKDMGFIESNINFVPQSRQPLAIGKLRCIHGWFTNLHHSKKHAEHIHNNVVYGHAHDMQSHTPKNVDPQHRFMSWCIGHLSDERKADYLRNRPTNWMLAFAIFWVDTQSGNFTLLPIPLPNYRFIYDGVLYKG